MIRLVQIWLISAIIILIPVLTSCTLPEYKPDTSVVPKSVAIEPQQNTPGQTPPAGTCDVKKKENLSPADPKAPPQDAENLSESVQSLVQSVINNDSGAKIKNDEDAGNDDEKNNTTDQEKMDEAINLLDQSQKLWEKGDLDGALEALDDAYTLVLEVNGSAEVSIQKDDLRFMIARRILEIYASRATAATGLQSEIPLPMNADIEREIKSFQNYEGEFFKNAYYRSGRYLPEIHRQLKEAGLPLELAWLPLVESGFKVSALSPARALGMWQFIPSTGYKFGLSRDTYVDERMDVEKSTRAAIAYMTELHKMFGDWLTVLAAYNCGESRVLNVISRQQINYLDNFWDLYRQLPNETARYVPRFLATLHIIKDPKKFGIYLSPQTDTPICYETITVQKRMKLADVAAQLGVTEETMESLNPELRYKITPDKEYALKIPADKTELFLSAIENISEVKAPGGPEYNRHKVRRGETLASIARKYHTSASAIASVNKVSTKKKLKVGRWLRIPTSSYKVEYVKADKVADKQTTSPKTGTTTAKGTVREYTVKKGDTLWLIAGRFNTTVSEIKRLSGLRTNNLSIGQMLTIKEGSGDVDGYDEGQNEPGGGKDYVVKKGDTPASIARQHGMGLQKFLDLNNLNNSSKIFPGQTLMVK